MIFLFKVNFIITFIEIIFIIVTTSSKRMLVALIYIYIYLFNVIFSLSLFYHYVLDDIIIITLFLLFKDLCFVYIVIQILL